MRGHQLASSARRDHVRRCCLRPRGYKQEQKDGKAQATPAMAPVQFEEPHEALPLSRESYESVRTENWHGANETGQLKVHAIRSNAAAMRCPSRVASLHWHSQTVTTFQPIRLSVRAFRRSLRTFFARF